MTIFLLVLAYLLGSIPFGLIVGKVGYGIDIREHGSGNLGATNTFRTLGKKAGIIVTVADILKGTVATVIPLLVGADMNALFFGIFAVVGHVFPLFAKFRGGKAVATSAGILLGYTPLLFVGILVCFIICLYLSKYVSLSSVITAVLAFTYTFFVDDIPLRIIMGLIAFIVVYRHLANMKRILNKTEPKITWL
ncbi:glycerol-3-phosphate 1-O-acyltransferase PlsY [Priestia filamentosa]|uniref:glycerol-3-phosphate 1-O-acyltransferase PlsY n=1 Tax=Priestia filamentosa TaxID=1402861 RepID=UPI002E21C3E2|nr:glycerol-3-phosphate 1-O-acyltransferase PlsY [Priestia filamentosa]MED3726098.1 glycerol-3-phosphate 1-O-acyltransferase PlsY [Priestia filamentosa]